MQKHFKIEKDILAIRKDAEQEENFAKLDTLFNLSNYNHSSLVDFSSTYHDYLSKFIYKGLVPATAVKQTDLMFKWLGIAGKQFKAASGKRNIHRITQVIHHIRFAGKKIVPGTRLCKGQSYRCGRSGIVTRQHHIQIRML